MTKTIAPELKPDGFESEEWPTLDRGPANTTRKQRVVDQTASTITMRVVDRAAAR